MENTSRGGDASFFFAFTEENVAFCERSFRMSIGEQEGFSPSSLSVDPSVSPHVSPAPPPIFTGSSQWSVGAAELGGRRGLPDHLEDAMLPMGAAPRFSPLRGLDYPQITMFVSGHRRGLHPDSAVSLVEKVLSNPEALGERAARDAALTEAPCRYWQSLLKRGDEDRARRTLDAVLGFVFELMGSNWGHHLFQRLVEACSEGQLASVVSAVAASPRQLMESAKHRNGRECVEKLLMAVKRCGHMVRQLTGALAVDVAGLMMDCSGHVLVQTCLVHLNAEQNQFIYTAALENLTKIARNKYGSPTINKCIEHARSPIRDRLVNAIISTSACLSQDPCGNYVVQRVIGLEDEEHTERLCRELRDHWVELAMHKNGSHVLERCIKSRAGWQHVAAALLSCGKLGQISIDAYGNYIVQLMLKDLKRNELTLYMELVRSLVPHAQSLRLHPHGRNVYRLLVEKSASAPN